MKVKDVMFDDFEIIHPDQTLRDAAQKMKESNLGALPVKENGDIIGLLTDRDITIRSTANGYHPEKMKVRDAMSKDVQISFEKQDVREATKKMQENNIRRLLVLNTEKKLVGMVSLVPW